MKKSLLLSVIIVGLGFCQNPEPPADTTSDTILISTLNHLAWLSGEDKPDSLILAERWSKTYSLINDIDAESTKNWNPGDRDQNNSQFDIPLGFSPIGAGGTYDYIGEGDDRRIHTPFTGQFIGNGFSISNLYIDRPQEFYIGLFGKVDKSSSINDLHLQNVYIRGMMYVGGITGSYSGQIGVDYGKAIQRCSVSGEITGDNTTGGITGYNGAAVYQCYSSVSISGLIQTGGITGNNGSDSYITECFSTGTISGNSTTGGIVGVNNGAIISTYSTGDITGSTNVGGIIGSSLGQYVSDCYSTGRITGDSAVGGIVGKYEGSLLGMNSYYKETTEVFDSYFGEVKSISDMKTQSTYTDWDFSQYWKIDEGESTPYFIWQDVNNIPNGSTPIRNTPTLVAAPQFSIHNNTLFIKDSKHTSLQVFSISGRLLIEIQNVRSPVSFNSLELANGIYPMRVIQGAEVFTGQFILR